MRRSMLPTLLSFLPHLPVSHALTYPPELFSSALSNHLLSPSSLISAAGSSVPVTFPSLTYPNNGTWSLSPPTEWTSAFFSATLWELAKRDKMCGGDGAAWADRARTWMQGLSPAVEELTNTHDLGFLSFPLQYDYENSPSADTASKIIQMANNLAARFSPVVGCTRSWDHEPGFPVIIDNMMNLQLFTYAADLPGGNATWKQLAKSHADKTLQNHVREDWGTWHVVNYDETTGAVGSKYTAQGYSNDSTWSRGQAWATYGFAQMYSSTQNTTYLSASISLANYFISHLSTSPLQSLPLWDFQAPLAPTALYDTSAATILASALLQLSNMTTQAGEADSFRASAGEVLQATVGASWKAGDATWQPLLANGTRDNNNQSTQSNNTGLVYGDYYFVKAGNLMLELGLVNCSVVNANVSTNGTSTNTGSGVSSSSSTAKAANTGTRLFQSPWLGLYLIIAAPLFATLT